MDMLSVTYSMSHSDIITASILYEPRSSSPQRKSCTSPRPNDIPHQGMWKVLLLTWMLGFIVLSNYIQLSGITLVCDLKFYLTANIPSMKVKQRQNLCLAFPSGKRFIKPPLTACLCVIIHTCEHTADFPYGIKTLEVYICFLETQWYCLTIEIEPNNLSRKLFQVPRLALPWICSSQTLHRVV